MSLSKNVTPREMKHDVQLLVNAVNAVHRGVPICAAARMFGLPKTMVQDAVRGGIKECKGPEPILLPHIEERIVSWVSHMADIEYGQTKNDILDKVQVLVNTLGLKTPQENGCPSDKWYRLFMGCHELLQYQMVSALSKEHAGVTYDHLYAWFLELKGYCSALGEFNLFEDATRVYNCDETGFPLAPKPWKVPVNIANTKHHYQSGFANTKAQIMVLMCASASSHYTKPLVVYSGVQPRNELRVVKRVVNFQILSSRQVSNKFRFLKI